MTIKDFISKIHNKNTTILVWFGNGSLEHKQDDETDGNVYSESIFYDSITAIEQCPRLLQEEVLSIDIVSYDIVQIRINEPATLIDLIGDKLTKGEVLYEVLNPNKITLLNTIYEEPKPTLELKDGMYILDYNTMERYFVQTNSADLIIDKIISILKSNTKTSAPNPTTEVDSIEDLREAIYQEGYDYETNNSNSITVPYLNNGEIIIVKSGNTYYVSNPKYDEKFTVSGKNAITVILNYINFVIL